MNKNDTLHQVNQAINSADYINLHGLLIWVLAIFLFFRITNYLLPLLLNKVSHRRYFNVSYPFIELITWIFLIVAGIQYYQKLIPAYSIGLFIVLLIILSFLGKVFLADLFAGIMMKFENQIRLGAHLNIDGVSGKVIYLGLRKVKIETESGETAYIPNSALTNKKFTIREPTEHIIRHQFSLFSKTSGEKALTAPGLKQFILQLPWVSLKKDVNVHINPREDGKLQYDISFYTNQKEQIQHIETLIRDKITSS